MIQSKEQHLKAWKHVHVWHTSRQLVFQIPTVLSNQYPFKCWYEEQKKLNLTNSQFFRYFLARQSWAEGIVSNDQIREYIQEIRQHKQSQSKVVAKLLEKDLECGFPTFVKREQWEHDLDMVMHKTYKRRGSKQNKSGNNPELTEELMPKPR